MEVKSDADIIEAFRLHEICPFWELSIAILASAGKVHI
jgi:hypothetical protein